MNLNVKMMIICVVIGIISISSVIAVFPIANSNANGYASELKNMGINVVHIYDISSVPLRTSVDKTAFTQMAKQAGTVYFNDFEFLVYPNASQTIAYQYNPPFW